MGTLFAYIKNGTYEFILIFLMIIACRDNDTTTQQTMYPKHFNYKNIKYHCTEDCATCINANTGQTIPKSNHDDVYSYCEGVPPDKPPDPPPDDPPGLGEVTFDEVSPWEELIDVIPNASIPQNFNHITYPSGTVVPNTI